MVFIDKETNDLSYKIIGCAYNVHKELGPGLLESAYKTCLCYELSKIEINYEKQKGLPIIYKDVTLDCGYRIDILVENKNGRKALAHTHSTNNDLLKIK